MKLALKIITFFFWILNCFGLLLVGIVFLALPSAKNGKIEVTTSIIFTMGVIGIIVGIISYVRFNKKQLRNRELIKDLDTK